MDALRRFLRQHDRTLRRYAHWTFGEYPYEDGAGTACVAWLEFARARRLPAEHLDDACDAGILRLLRRRIGLEVDCRQRAAHRLDQQLEGRDGTSRALNEVLAADDGDDPLSLLLEREAAIEEAPLSAAREEQDECPGDSLAAAWALLMRRFDNRQWAVARFLLISKSHARRRWTRVAQAAQRQDALVFSQIDAATAPRPWRRERHDRAPRQFELDFDPRLF